MHAWSYVCIRTQLIACNELFLFARPTGLYVGYSDMEEQGGGGGDDLGLVADMETELQGVLDSYPDAGACGGNDQQDQLAAMAGLRSTFQGVEPMGMVGIFVLFVCC